MDNEADLCIICRCDDADGENNGPLGYLGHVQRSRMLQMRAVGEWSGQDAPSPKLVNMYRVVGHMGCQVSHLSTEVRNNHCGIHLTHFIIFFRAAKGN